MGFVFGRFFSRRKAEVTNGFGCKKKVSVLFLIINYHLPESQDIPSADSMDTVFSLGFYSRQKWEVKNSFGRNVLYLFHSFSTLQGRRIIRSDSSGNTSWKSLTLSLVALPCASSERRPLPAVSERRWPSICSFFLSRREGEVNSGFGRNGF